MRFWVILVTGLMLASGAMAQGKPKATTPDEPAGQPSARQMNLSRRYVELVQGEQLEDMIREMIVGEANADASLRDMPAEDRTFLIELTTEITTDLVPQMMDRLVPVYARVFSREELEALVAFYESDLGRSIADKTVASLPEANTAMMSVLPQMYEKMAARICARYGCDAAEMRATMEGAIPGVAPQSDGKR